MIGAVARLGGATLLALVLAIGGCNRSDDASGPGDTSVSEAKALDDAANMIESHRPPPPVVTPSGPLPPSPSAGNQP